MPKRSPLLTIDASRKNGKPATPTVYNTPSVSPAQPSSMEGASTFGGQVYIAPWSRLAAALPSDVTTLLTTAAIHAVGDNAVLSHYLYGNEQVRVVGGPEQKGGLYEYTITRGAQPISYPATETVFFNLGTDTDGGYIVLVSGNQTQGFTGPRIAMYGYTDGTPIRKLVVGNLTTLTVDEEALFPDVTDWNTFGLYADSVFLRGDFDVQGGHVRGDLIVDKTVSVAGGIDNAGVVIGDTPAGFGWSLNDMRGRPVIAAVSPYTDDGTTEVAFFIEHEGTRGLYYHKSATTGKYVLDIGADTIVDGFLRAPNILSGEGTFPGAFTGTRLGSEGIYTYGTDFLPQVEIPSDSGFLYFGNREGWLSRDGITIDSRALPVGVDEFEHTLKWLNSSNYSSDFIGAAVGSYPQGGLFAVARRIKLDVDANDVTAQGIDDFYQSSLLLLPGGTSSLIGKMVHLVADDRMRFQVDGRLIATLENSRASFSAVSVAGSLMHTTDDGMTVAFGTNSPPVGSRVVVQEDTQTALMLRRSNDQFLSVYLQASVPAGQQSAPTSGYVMRANSTIGISQANASAEWIAIQNWLRTHGLQPYTPQLAILGSQNIGSQYDEGTSGLDWSASAIDATALFPAPLVFDYTEFFYKTSPNSLAWTLSGSPVTQDAIDPGVLATVLGNTLSWFRANGIADPWMMIDEPPPSSSDRWTQAIEDRVIKFAAAAVASGWKVGVAMPGPSQLAYWRTRLTPTRWILAAKHERVEYAATLPSGEIWLYNRTNKDAGKPMAGLAQQMRDFGAIGYLHWSAESSDTTWPLVTLSGLTVTETLYGTQLIDELRLFAETDIPPVQAVNNQWLTTSGTLILNARSGYVTRPPSFPVSLGSIDQPFSHVYAQHLHGTLGSQTAIASGSSMYVSAFTLSLAVGLEVGNTTAYAEQEDIPVGKFFKATNPNTDEYEVIKVQSTGLAAGDWWEYEVERGLAGTEQFWPEGTTWTDLGGNNVDGFIRIWGADDELATTGPAIGIWQRDNDDAYDSTSLRFLAGNLNGFYDFSANTWGLAAGRHAGKWFSVTDEGGLRIMDANIQRAVYREYAQIGNPEANNVLITDSTLQLGVGETYTISMDGSGNMDLTGTLAVATGGAITWAGTKGKADNTGIEHVENASNYWKVKPDTSFFVEIHTEDGASTFQALNVYEKDGIGIYTYGGAQGISAVSTYGEGVRAQGATGILAFDNADYGIGVHGKGTYANSVGVKAEGVGDAAYSLKIIGKPVDGGSQRYTAMADATADTDGLNRQTGDGRYLLQTGTATGATSQAQTFTNGIIGPSWKPASDSTTALQIQQAGGTPIITVDTTNKTVGINESPLTSAGLIVGQSVNSSVNSTGVYVKATRVDHTFPVGTRNVNGMDIYTYTTAAVSDTKTSTQAGFTVSSNVSAATGLTATVATVAGIRVSAPSITGSGTKTITASRGLWISNQGNANIANTYGVYIDQQTGAGTASYAIYSLGGQSQLWAGAATVMPLALKGAASQSANLLEGWDSSSNVVAYIGPTGGIVANEQGLDADSRFEGDTATQLLVMDAGLDAVQIGTTTAGVIADFRTTGTVFNEDGTATRDFRVESDTEANMLFLDADADTDGALYLGGSTNGIKISKGGDLTLLGTAKYERHVQIDAKADGTVANQPSQVDFFTAGGLQFASVGAKYAYCQWEVPDDWDGGDVYFEIDWFPDSGGTSGTDAVRWTAEYRAIAEGEAINNGTSVTVDNGAGGDTTDYAQYITKHTRFTLAYNDANQPLTKQDHVYFKISRDTGVANDFAGTVTVTAYEIIYQSTGFPTSN